MSDPMSEELVGVAEIAAMLGVSRQRVDQLAAAEDFPPPLAELAAGRIWARAAVEEWMAGEPARLPGGEAGGLAAKFSEATRRTLVSAQEIARRLKHSWVGTEHLLLAVLSGDARTDVVAAASKLGIQFEEAERAVTRLVPRGDAEVVGTIAFTPRTAACLELAQGLAADEGADAIEPRHLLAALAQEGAGVAASVMAEISGQRAEQLGAGLAVALKAETRRGSRWRATKAAPDWKCSFCSKVKDHAKKLIAGPGVAICDECIELCDDILREEEGRPSPDLGAQLSEIAGQLDKLARAWRQ